MKYIVSFDSTSIEFSSQEEATSYLLSSGLLRYDIVSEQEYNERILAKKKRETGLHISNLCIESIGARNKILALSGTQVTQMLQALSPIRALLETGALGTARSALTQLRAAYTSHSDIFTSVISDINTFEQENGL